MTYIIHYLFGAAHDGVDFLETEHEYYARKAQRTGEGWERIGSYTEGGDTVLVMHMADRSREVRA